MRPPGFLEDPFIFPTMSCPICGFRFVFKDPLGYFDRVKCVKCGKESDIPEPIIAEFLENIEFMDYLQSRRKHPIRNSPPQPPFMQEPM